MLSLEARNGLLERQVLELQTGRQGYRAAGAGAVGLEFEKTKSTSSL